MSDEWRKQRIERLFEELQYEITRGVMQHDITERMKFSFVIPISQEGEDWAVCFVADLRPMPRWSAPLEPDMGKLKVIEGGKQ